MNDFNCHIRGTLASIFTATSAVMVWTVVEGALRFTIELLGLVAGYYAARYWHYKFENRKKRTLKDPETDI